MTTTISPPSYNCNPISHEQAYCQEQVNKKLMDKLDQIIGLLVSIDSTLNSIDGGMWRDNG